MRKTNGRATWLAGIGLGAAAMYVFDPDRGRRRRAMLADKAALAVRELGDAADVTVRDLLNRSRGIVAESWSRFRPEEVSDPVLEQRVRARLGRLTSHPAAIEVTAQNGMVILRGPVLQSEVDCVISGVASVRGVLSIDNQLGVHAQPGDSPDLQGSSTRHGERFELMQEHWAPGPRLLVGTAGTALAVAGFARKSLPGAVLGSFGLALLARSITNYATARLLGRRGGHAIDLQKTVHVHAPIEEVFGLWQNPENFPRFMSHVYRVEKTGENRHRWSIAGPAGLPVIWSALMTQNVPEKLIAWRSEPGSVVQSSGIIRFDREDGGTRVHVRMSYHPPGGAIGHAIASLFGVDPKHAMDDDMARFKSLIEIGKTRAHGERVTRQELVG